MVQGYPTSHYPGTGRRITGGARSGKGSFSFRPIHGWSLVIPSGEIHDRHPYDGWNAHTQSSFEGDGNGPYVICREEIGTPLPVVWSGR